MLSIRVALVVFACAAVLSRPAPTAARTSDAASLAGVVRDVSGGVLPGVTVEVASPVLIEKARTAVTDGQGLYRVDVRRPLESRPRREVEDAREPQVYLLQPIFNLVNAGNVLNMTTRCGSAWLNAIQITGGRSMKVSLQLDF